MWNRLKRLARRFVPAAAEAEEKLIDDARTYWGDSASKKFSTNSHWRGHGPFVDDALWLRLGAMHLALVEALCASLARDCRFDRVVEWGCGGGMNAVAFSPVTAEYIGVDISAASVAECERQLRDAGFAGFTGVHFDAAEPGSVRPRAGGECDLFLSTYVYELLPTPEYGIRVLNEAAEMLRPGGLALIQIRYSDGSPWQNSKYAEYAQNIAQMTTYGIEDFWQHAEAAGFTPQFVKLVPKQPELNEKRYAYFALQK